MTDREAVRLPVQFDTTSGLAGLLRLHGVPVEFESACRSKYRIYFDATPGRRSWALDFPVTHSFGDDLGSGIAGMTYDEACEAFRAAMLGEDALRAFCGPAWISRP